MVSSKSSRKTRVAFISNYATTLPVRSAVSGFFDPIIRLIGPCLSTILRKGVHILQHDSDISCTQRLERHWMHVPWIHSSNSFLEKQPATLWHSFYQLWPFSGRHARFGSSTGAHIFLIHARRETISVCSCTLVFSCQEWARWRYGALGLKAGFQRWRQTRPCNCPCWHNISRCSSHPCLLFTVPSPITHDARYARRFQRILCE